MLRYLVDTDWAIYYLRRRPGVMRQLGGLFILAGIIPVRLPEPEQILGLVATVLGALAALGTAWYWLSDATG